MIYFTSDLHLGHKNVIKLSNRPFSCVQEMNNVLIENWNKTVSNNDDIYCLGDIFFAGNVRWAAEILASLNGNIYLLRGNHDKIADKLQNSQIPLKKFIWIKDYFKLKVQDNDAHNGQQQIILCHYAFYVWDKAHYGSWNLFAHSHGNLKVRLGAKQFDVGVDSVAQYLAKKNDCEIRPEFYKPISYNEIKEIMATKIFIAVDHHTENTNN